MKKNQIDFITLGCSKNLVDSEVLMKQFEANGYRCTHDSKRPQGEIAVINTCGFIGDAKEESINTILEFADAKEKGRLKKLFVMGCLSQRYKSELEKEIPQVDKYYGKFDYKQLLADLGKAEIPSCKGQRVLTTPHHYAYIKISEGCDRHCAYCAIPLITGRHVSRPKAEILDEVRQLVSTGVKEFQIIAQELTYYGLDIDEGISISIEDQDEPSDSFFPVFRDSLKAIDKDVTEEQASECWEELQSLEYTVDINDTGMETPYMVNKIQTGYIHSSIYGEMSRVDILYYAE